MPSQFEAAVTAVPMFGAPTEPPMFQPFNLGGRGGMAAQIFLPMLAQSWMSTQGMVPSQFMPTQNFYDQLAARTYWNQQQLAMHAGASRDVQSIRQTILGAQTLISGRAPTFMQQVQAYRMSNELQGALPILSMIAGPGWADALMGPRGSATIMAQQLHRGLRFSRDPFTGAQGVTGRAAGQIAVETFEQLYGAGVPLGEMRGIGAGQMGALFHELSLRGMAGPTFGAMTPEARMRQLATAQFGEGTMRRVAESRLRAMGRDVTRGNIEAVTQEIFGRRDAATGQRLATPETTLGRIRGAVNADNIDIRALEQLGGAQELITAGSAQRITSRLKDLSGAVSAMRDIFGDIGRPDAPMREIINGLEALTQGGLSTMSPAQVERLVRTTRNLAQTSGLGIEGILGLQAQAAGMADRLGLDRSLAVQATQGAAAFAIAARQTHRLDIPAFGGLTAEEATLLDVQLRTQAAGSQTTNMLAATVRMQQEGMLQGDSNAARMARAVRDGRTTWTDAAGRTRSMQMTNAQWIQLMRESGANVNTAQAVLGDVFANQQYTRDFDIANRITRTIQADVDIRGRVRNVFANTLRGQMAEQGISQILRRTGVVGTERDLAQVQARMGEQLAQSLFRADAATVRDPVRLNQYLARQVEQQIAAQVRAAGGDDAAVQQALNALGPQDANGIRRGALEMGLAMRAALGNQIRFDPNMRGYRSVVGLWQMQNPITQAQQAAAVTEAQTLQRIQSEYARLGRMGPIQRLIGAIQEAEPGTTFTEIMMRTLGGVPEADIARLERGPVGGLLAANRQFRQAERYTEAQARQEAMDREAAQRAGMSLEAYRERQRTTLGKDWRDKAEDYQQLRRDVEKDETLRANIEAMAAARASTLTGHGMAQRAMLTRITSAMITGGAEAEAALGELARAVLGPDATAAGFSEEYFESRLRDAKTDRERQQVEDLRRMVGSLQMAQQGETAGVALGKAGLMPGTKTRATSFIGRLAARAAGASLAGRREAPEPGTPEDIQRRMAEAAGLDREIGASKEGGRQPSFKLTGRVRIENPDALLITGDVTTGDHENNDVQTGVVGTLVPTGGP